MLRARLLAVAVAFALVGCAHVTTAVPGVLDTSSDGSGASPDTKQLTDPTVVRTGFDAILWGDGVKQAGSHVDIADKKMFLLQILPIANQSATEEIAAANKDVALKKVQIGDTQTLIDGVIAVVVRSLPFVNIVGLVLPPTTATLSGDRIQVAAAAPVVPDAAPAAGF